MSATRRTVLRVAGAGAVVVLAAGVMAPVSAGASPALSRGQNAGAAAAGLCAPDSGGTDIDDVDGDGRSDVVVGVPDRAAGASTAGVLDVHGSASGAHVVSGASIAGIGASPEFGASVAEATINADAYTDVVVGDPGHAGGGAVDILFGGASGLRTTGVIQIPARTAADRFGTAVAVQPHYVTQGGDFDFVELWVGAPGRTAGGVAGAGAVDHYRIDPDGAVTLLDTYSADNPLIPIQPSVDDHLGDVILPSGGDVAIGAPDADFAGQVDSGEVLLVRESTTTQLVADAALVGQDTPTVPGTSEPGDHFGAALSLYGGFLVGVPGEDIGSIADAGVVQSIVPTFPHVRGGKAFSENSPGVPGTAEAGDEFGAALATAPVGYIDQSVGGDTWIGVPGESIGSTAGAGVVIQIATRYYEDTGGDPYGNAFTSYKTLHQGSSTTLGGAVTAGTHVGQTLSALPVRASDTWTEAGVAIGVPGMTVGSTAAAGVVESFGGADNDTVLSCGYSPGPVTDQHYGSILG